MAADDPKPYAWAEDEARAPLPAVAKRERPRCRGKRPDGSVCGLPMRGDLVEEGYAYAGIADPTGGVVVVESGPPRCHVCPLLAMTSQDVREGDEMTAFASDVERSRWRGREDEANAWRFDWLDDDGTEVESAVRDASDQWDVEMILAGLRPRAVVEYSGDIGQRRVYGALENVRGQLVQQTADESPGWPIGSQFDSAGGAADARVGHTSRGVPSFSVHDRYVVDTWLPGDPEPSTWEHGSGSGTPKARALNARRRYVLQNVSTGEEIEVEDNGAWPLPGPAPTPDSTMPHVVINYGIDSLVEGEAD